MKKDMNVDLDADYAVDFFSLSGQTYFGSWSLPRTRRIFLKINYSLIIHGSVEVKALRYKPKSRGFDVR
jgi:hypothetical protein